MCGPALKAFRLRRDRYTYTAIARVRHSSFVLSAAECGTSEGWRPRRSADRHTGEPVRSPQFDTPASAGGETDSRREPILAARKI
jgi:hypothetical protein